MARRTTVRSRSPPSTAARGRTSAAKRGAATKQETAKPRRVAIVKPGGYGVLKMEDMEGAMQGGKTVLNMDQPTPDNTCLIQVHAAGVNYADICIRWGLYGSFKRFVGYPGTPGFEFSGTVLDVGRGGESDARGLRVGDEVFGVTLFGAYSSHINVPVSQVFRLPKELTPEAAAGFPCAAMTAYYALDRLAASKEGDTVLVHSAAGGVGTMLCQLAKARGCRVVGVVGRRDKVAVALRAGCAAVVEKESGGIAQAHTSDPDAVEWVPSRPSAALAGRALHEALDRAGRLVGGRPPSDTPAGGPFHAAFDANGVSTLRISYDLLAPTGKLVVYGFHSMLPRKGGKLGVFSWLKLAWDYVRTPRFNPMSLTSENRSVMGFNLSYLFDEQAELQRAMSDLLGYVSRGELRVASVRTFPLTDVASAHACLESGATTGKLVLLCS